MAAKKRELTKAEQEAIDKLAQTYEQLKKVRASTTLALKPTPNLRTTLLDSKGKESPFNLRYYQSIGIYHLLAMKRMVLGDDTGTGKTVQTLGALCYLWPKENENKAIVIAPKSALFQWASEVQKFTTGVRTIVVSGSLEERKKAYQDFFSAKTGPDAERVILILNYAILVRDWDYGAEIPKLPNGRPDPKKGVTPGLLDGYTQKLGKNAVLIFDEAHAFKNTSTKTWQTCRMLADRSHRVYGLTATLLKNRLIEGFAIYKVIFPNLFSTKSKFMDDFCVVKLQPVGGGRKVPIVVGYRNLDQFKAKIDPFFIGRKKHEISNELPKLLTKEIICELSPAEDAKYAEALSGVLVLGDGEVKDYAENKAMTSLIYCQQVVNSLSMLRFTSGAEVGDLFFPDEVVPTVKELSSKEAALLDLLTGELEDEKVIVYTRFASLVPRLQELVSKEKIKNVAITGKVKDKDRKAAQDAFQDLDSDTKVIFITDAGSQSINLQAASSLVFFDAPWSWGDYIQTLGRPIRIGSTHQNVVVYHLIAERPGHYKKDRKTIDRYVLDLLHMKKELIDQVLGEAAVGALEFDKGADGAMALLRNMRADSNGLPPSAD